MRRPTTGVLALPLLGLVAFLICAVPVEGGPIVLSFSGTMASGFLDYQGQQIDVTGAAFTATAITTGPNEFEEFYGFPPEGLGGLYPAITYWDFGELGWGVWADEHEYLYIRDNQNGSSMVALRKTTYPLDIDGRGIWLFTDQPFGENLTVFDADAVTILPDDLGPLNLQRWWDCSPDCVPLTVTSASVRSVPEPSTLLLLGTGLVGLLTTKRSRCSQV